MEDLLGNKRKRNNSDNKTNVKIKNNLLKECNSNSIKIDKKIFLKKNVDLEKKNDYEINSNSGNEETENQSKSHSNTSITSHLNTLDKDLNEKVVIQIEQIKS